MALSIKYADFDHTGGTEAGTVDDPWESWTTLNTNVAAGDHVYIAQTTSRYDPGSEITFSKDGSNTQPIILEGYKTSTGDGGAVDFANCFQWGSSSSARGLLVTGDNVHIRYWDIESRINYGAAARNYGNNSVFYKSKIKQYSSTDAYALQCNLASTTLQCYIDHGTAPSVASIGVQLSINSALIGCYINGNLGTNGWTLVRVDNTSSNCEQVIGCILQGSGAANGQTGVRFNGTQGDDMRLVMGCSFRDLGEHISFSDIKTSGLGKNTLIGNLMYDGTDGVVGDAGATFALQMLGQAIGGMSSDRYDSLGDLVGILPDVTLTADPYTSSTDWSLNATAGGGAAAKDVLEPVDTNFDNTDHNSADIGAVQDGS